MWISQSKVTYFLHFLPGVLILLVSMFALHGSVSLQHDYEKLRQYYTLMSSQHSALTKNDNTAQMLTIQRLSDKIKERKSVLYWSVFVSSLIAFILFILNADKLGKIRRVHSEKEKTLALLTERLAAIEASMDGVGIVDHKGNLTYMNTALMALHGIALEDKDKYLGRPWLNLYSEKGQAYVQKHVLPEFERNVFWRGASKILRNDGKLIKTDLTMTKLDSGGFIGTARDITEQVQAEAEKKKMEEQFFQAQKMEAIGRLAGGIAHDFNNILAAINGYAEFLEQDLDKNSPEHGFAKNIMQAGNQARSLVDKILAFSRYDTNDMSTIDLRDPIHESLSMLRATLPRTIDLNATIDDKGAYIKGNTTQITQMLMNLCVNAGDAIEGDKGTIYVELSLADIENNMPLDLIKEDLPDPEKVPLIRIEDGKPAQTRLYMGHCKRKHDYIKLSVMDSGTGMSRVVLEHIFEPFFTTKDINKGTGLGLPMVHATVTAHSALLAIDTAIDQGTRFDLYFPATSKRAMSAETLQTVQNEENVSANLLLVEDEKLVRQMTQTMMERMGYNVETANEGLEALDILRENPGHFDIVITDQNMPKMTGIELINQAYIDFPDLPFILLSGYSEERLKKLMKEHPSVKAILHKPVSKADLNCEIVNVLAEQASDKNNAVNA